MQNNELLQIGVVTSPHGVKGDVKVFPTTDDPSKFKRIKSVQILEKNRNRVLTIESVRFFKNLVLVKFKGVDNMDDAELLRNAALMITREQSGPLKKDSYYIEDLIGVSVYADENKDTPVGSLTKVLQTGANDVYEITYKEGCSFLIPAVKEWIKEVNIEAKTMIVHFPSEFLAEYGESGS